MKKQITTEDWGKLSGGVIDPVALMSGTTPGKRSRCGGIRVGLELDLAGGPDCIGPFVRSTGILGYYNPYASAALKRENQVTRTG